MGFAPGGELDGTMDDSDPLAAGNRLRRRYHIQTGIDVLLSRRRDVRRGPRRQYILNRYNAIHALKNQRHVHLPVHPDTALSLRAAGGFIEHLADTFLCSCLLCCAELSFFSLRL